MKLKSVLIISALTLPFVFPAQAKYNSPTDELREMVHQLQERVAELEKYKATVPFYVISGNEALGIKLSGQVNRAVLWARRDNDKKDDGSDVDFDDSEIFNVDNDAVSTRFNVTGRSGLGSQGTMLEDMFVGTRLSLDALANSTADIEFNSKSQSPSFDVRKAELYFHKVDYGRVWMGLGDTATDGVTEIDLSGTEVVAYSGTQDFAGGLEFMPDVKVKDVFMNLDGFRDVRFQYATERYNGFSAKADFGEDSDYTGALYYSNAFDTFKLAAGFGYTHWRSAEDDKDMFSGSASVLYDGFSLTLAGGFADDDSADDDTVEREITTGYIKLGYQYDNNAFSIDFGKTDIDADASADLDYEGITVGLAAVHTIPYWATEVYLGARWYKVDIDASVDIGKQDTQWEDEEGEIFGVMLGSRIKF